MLQLIAGVDEAGRGSLAGPVVASAVILLPDRPIKDLRDSKKLSEKKRDLLYDEIVSNSLSVGIGIVHENDIEEINILKATHKAMRIALGMLTRKPHEALIDGFPLPDQVIKNKGVIRGDNKIPEISAASIIAKVTRDRIMKNYSLVFPNYGFHSNKGYGTKDHISFLKKHLACPIHRKTFSPVSDYMPALSNIIKSKAITEWSVGLASRELVRKDHRIIDVYTNQLHKSNFDVITQKGKVVVFSKIFSIIREKPNTKKRIIQSQIENIKKEMFNYGLNKTYKCRFDIITVIYDSGLPKIEFEKEIISL